MIRIASGQGFWGDWLEAPIRQVEGGPIDFLVLDYLAEVTMSIMQKQRARDPRAGYAKDFVEMIDRVLPAVVERKIKVIANAGGVNPRACAQAVLDVASKHGLAGKVKAGIVLGDDIMDRLDEFAAKGAELLNMDTGEPLSRIRSSIQSANVYFGAKPVVEALQKGANIIVTGRVTDTGLTLAPMVYTFGWDWTDWDKIAAGTIAGHTIECGAQCTGGNCQVDWESIPDMAGVGFPIVEAELDGTYVVTKHKGTGGRVTVATVKEQLVYEMGDPREYITPDGIADFTSIQLDDAGEDRVRIHGIRGHAETPFYKVSISYSAGYKAVGTLVYAWPDAYKKAQAADQILRRRLEMLGLKFSEILTEYVGVDACHGPLSGEPSPDLSEVQLRVGVRSDDKAAVTRFTREIAPLVLTGPPTVTGFAGGRPKVEEIVAYWPALIPKSLVQPRVEIV